MNVLKRLMNRIFGTEIVYIDTDEHGDWFAVGPTAKPVCLTEETHTDNTKRIKTNALVRREVLEYMCSKKFIEVGRNRAIEILADGRIITISVLKNGTVNICTPDGAICKMWPSISVAPNDGAETELVQI